MTVVVLLLLRETRAGLTHSLNIPASVGPDRKCPLGTQQVSPAVQPRAELRERVFIVFSRVDRNHAVHPPSRCPPTVCTLSFCLWWTIWLAAERLWSSLIGPAASRTHCPCVPHVNTQCRVVVSPPLRRHRLAQYSWHYGTFLRFLGSFVCFAADNKSASTLVTAGKPISCWDKKLKLWDGKLKLWGFFLIQSHSSEINKLKLWDRKSKLWDSGQIYETQASSSV